MQSAWRLASSVPASLGRVNRVAVCVGYSFIGFLGGNCHRMLRHLLSHLEEVKRGVGWASVKIPHSLQQHQAPEFCPASSMLCLSRGVQSGPSGAVSGNHQ